MTISAQKNDFPIALGARITGVDDSMFSITGDSFSAISLSGANSHTSRVLQEDDVSLAYECNDHTRTQSPNLLPTHQRCAMRYSRKEVPWVYCSPSTPSNR